MDASASDISWLRALAGTFLVFEGPDGSGKTTQMRRFKQMLDDAGLATVEVREGYLTQAKQFPQSYRLINAARGPEEIWKDVVGTLQGFARCRS